MKTLPDTKGLRDNHGGHESPTPRPSDAAPSATAVTIARYAIGPPNFPPQSSLSITASSAIEGVVADADRAQRIIDRRTMTLRNRSEQELAGYRDAQDYLIREDWRPLMPA
jgi:hypothetical protein